MSSARWIIALAGLAIVVCGFAGGRAQIAAQEVVRETRDYDIRFLTRAIVDAPATTRPSAGRLLLDWAGAHASTSPISLTSDISEDEDVDATVPAGVRVDPDALVALIQRNIAEDSWANSRNSIDAGESRLSVTQTPDVHARIAALLEALGARRAHRVIVDVLLVPADPTLGDAPFVSREEFEAAAQRAGARAERLTLAAYNEQLVGTFVGRQRSVQVGLHINQTGVTPVPGPSIATLPLGTMVEVRPLAVSGTDLVRLELDLRRLRESGKPAPLELAMGLVESVTATESSLSSVLLVDSRRAAHAGTIVDASDPKGERRFSVLVRARSERLREERPVGAAGDDAFVMRVHDIGLITHGAAGIDAHTLVEALRSLVERDAWEDERASIEATDDARFLRVVATAATQRAVASWIANETARNRRIASIVVEERSGPLVALLALRASAEGDTWLTENWRESDAARATVTRSRVAAFGFAGTRIVARAIEAQTYTSDLDSVSGGTGYAIVERCAPVRRSAGSGLRVEATVRRGLDDDGLLLDLDLERAHLDLSTTSEVSGLTDPPVRGSGSGGAQERARSQERVRVPLALPSQRVARFACSLPVGRGRDAILRIEDDGDGGGRVYIARAELHLASDTVAAAPAEPSGGQTAPASDGSVRRELRIFDVSRLVHRLEDRVYAIADPPRLGLARSWSDVFDPSRDDWFDSRYVEIRDESSVGVGDHLSFATRGTFDPEEIADFIATIDADSWRDERNSLDFDRERLIVVQTPAVISRVDALLRGLEREAERLVAIEVAIVPPEVLDALAPRWRAPSSPVCWDSELFDRAVVAAGARGGCFASRVRPSAWESLSARAFVSRLADIDVNQTGVTPVADPRVAIALHGTRVLAFAVPTSDLSAVRVDLRAARIADAEEPGAARLSVATLELAHEVNEQLGTSVVVPFDRTTVVGFDATSSDGRAGSVESGAGFVTLLRSRIVAGEGGGASRDGQSAGRRRTPRWLDAAALLLALPDWSYELGARQQSFVVRSERAEESETDETPRVRLFGAVEAAPGARAIDPSEALVDVERSPLGTTRLERELLACAAERQRDVDDEGVPYLRLRADSGRLLWSGDAATGDALAARLAELEREHLRQVVVDVWHGPVSAAEVETLATGAARLGDEWLAKFADPSGRRVRVVGLRDAKCSLASVRARSYVASVDNVSGGTGFAIVEVGDPRVASLAHGILLNVSTHSIAGLPWLEVELEADLADSPRFERRGRFETSFGDAGGARAQSSLTFELPETRGGEEWRQRLTMEPGRPVLLGITPAGDAGASRAAIAVVRIVDALAASDAGEGGGR